MNEKFFNLSKEKQERIINAAYKVFSRNSYKKSSMNEIAQNAAISKSLLFHYFKNKKELYLFLWKKGAKITEKYLKDYDCYESDDLFEKMERIMRGKMKLIKKHPYMAFFVIRAFYESDTEIGTVITKTYTKMMEEKTKRDLAKLNPDDFVPGIDLKMMYREMYWAAEGYLWEVFKKGEFDLDKMEQDFMSLLDFWKKIYSNKERKHESSGD